MRTKKRKSNRAALMALTLALGAVPVASIASGAALWLAAAVPARAAAVPVERIADGQVVTKNNAPIAGAIVFLKDSRSQSIRTYICDQQGRFRFGELAQDTDYEIWAEANGVRSKTKAISSFDSKNNYNFTLKIDSAK